MIADQTQMRTEVLAGIVCLSGLIANCYAMVARVAQTRGINPDAPRHLKKVTETV